MRVFCADGTLADAPQLPADWSFLPLNLGLADTEREISLPSWLTRSGVAPEADLLLQMDIEGGEYETLPFLPEGLLARFRIIVVEVHQVHRWWQRSQFTLGRALFERLLRDHLCVHIHANNIEVPRTHAGLTLPTVLEFTFLRRDRITLTNRATTFPHPLDRPNLADHPDVVLPPEWFSAAR
jgi:hypothetical protein